MTAANPDLITIFTTKPATCTWTIKDFLNSQDNSSEMFCFSKNVNKKFQMNIFPNQKVPKWNNTCVAITISGTDAKTLKISRHEDHQSHELQYSIYYRISLINEKGEMCHSQEGRSKFEFEQIHRGYTYHWDKYYNNKLSNQFTIARDYLQDKANGLLPDGNLTIYCEVFDLDDSTISSGFNKDNLIELANDNQTLLDSGKLSDIVLVVGKQEFKAHKLILSSRSVVFAAMFEHDLEERKQNRVEIIDMSVGAFKDFLKFIYTGKVSHLDQYATELFAAADKYQIVSLRNFCEHYLAMSLSISTVPSVYQLAELYNCEQLKSKCIDYISVHSTEFKFEDWKQLTVTRPELAFKLYQIIGNKVK